MDKDTLLLIVEGLFGVVLLLVGVIGKMHIEADKEAKKDVEEEISSLRSRMHDVESQVAGLSMIWKMKNKPED